MSSSQGPQNLVQNGPMNLVAPNVMSGAPNIQTVNYTNPGNAGSMQPIANYSIPSSLSQVPGKSIYIFIRAVLNLMYISNIFISFHVSFYRRPFLDDGHE